LSDKLQFVALLQINNHLLTIVPTN